MSARVQALADRLAQMSVRERALILGAAICGLLIVWDALVLRPWQETRRTVAEQRLELDGRIQTLQARAAELEARRAADPHADLRRRIAALRGAVARLDESVREHGSELVEPAEMTHVLETLLASRPALRVLKLEGLPARPLIEFTEAGPAAIYRHAMRIEIEATFGDTVAFLREIEELPQRLFWDELVYEVTEHPKARVALVVHTLSSQEGWIGA